MKITAGQLADSYSLVVIGSGPAGLTVARKYTALTNKRVLIIESGPSMPPAGRAGRLAEVEARGDIPAEDYYRHSPRRLGGASNVWSGFCATLEKRSFLNGEWPIEYRELSRWYPEAAGILELPEDVHAVPEAPMTDDGAIVFRPLHRSKPVRFNAGNKALMDYLASDPQVDILFNHTVTAARIKQAKCVGVTAVPTAHNHPPPPRII